MSLPFLKLPLETKRKGEAIRIPRDATPCITYPRDRACLPCPLARTSLQRATRCDLARRVLSQNDVTSQVPPCGAGGVRIFPGRRLGRVRR
jgi:hypothetical protein